MKKNKTDKDLEEKFSKLLKSVNPYHVFTANKQENQVFLNKKLIEVNELGDLKSQVTFFRQSSLWKILNETVRAQSMERMFISSKTLDDMTFGKAMLFNLGIQDKILELIEKQKIVDNK